MSSTGDMNCWVLGGYYHLKDYNDMFVGSQSEHNEINAKVNMIFFFCFCTFPKIALRCTVSMQTWRQKHLASTVQKYFPAFCRKTTWLLFLVFIGKISELWCSQFTIHSLHKLDATLMHVLQANGHCEALLHSFSVSSGTLTISNSWTAGTLVITVRTKPGGCKTGFS